MAGLLGRNQNAANNRSTTNRRRGGTMNTSRRRGTKNRYGGRSTPRSRKFTLGGKMPARRLGQCPPNFHMVHGNCVKDNIPPGPNRGGRSSAGNQGVVYPRPGGPRLIGKYQEGGRTRQMPKGRGRGRKMAQGGLTIDACPPHLIPDGGPCTGNSVCCSRDCRQGTCYGGKDFRGAKRGGRKSNYGRGGRPTTRRGNPTGRRGGRPTTRRGGRPGPIGGSRKGGKVSRNKSRRNR
jgi:hypothetical protein